MTATIGVCPCPPIRDFERVSWTRLVWYNELCTAFTAGHGIPWMAGQLCLTLLDAKGLELQSFSYPLAILLVAGPVFVLCLPCFSQSALCGGVPVGVAAYVGFFSFLVHGMGSIDDPTQTQEDCVESDIGTLKLLLSSLPLLL
eukprot:1155184-Pelagomonas_calceolata.AAC.3